MRRLVVATAVLAFEVPALAAAQTGPTDPGRAPKSQEQISARLEEIIVTAQKREERLQDVPVPVTAIDAASLVSNNQLRLQDYYLKVPGLGVAIGNSGAPVLTLRGVTTGGFAIPTVGTIIDDVPFGATSLFSAGFAAPADLDPSDLERIEVLRGPQGTLYGASSMGGLLKYVTVDPSTDSFGAGLKLGTSAVSHGDSLGYNLRGAVNVPVSDTFAFRASAFTREDPGYIDNVRNGRKDVNSIEAVGGRVAALWRPSDTVSVKLSALYQDSQGNGTPYEFHLPGLKEQQQDVLPGSGGYEQRVQSYTANVTAKFGNASFTSLTGYSIGEFSDLYDMTAVVGGLVLPAFGVRTTEQFDDVKTEKFSQELRLATPIGEKVDWLLGAFYTHENSHPPQGFIAVDDNADLIGLYLFAEAANTFTEYAAFTNFTFQLTDRFDLQVGGRESFISVDQTQIWAGPYVPANLHHPSPLIPPYVSLDDNAFTYLVTPRFKVSPDLMIYARLASGYRPGGFSSNPTTTVLPTFKPDTTANYELGMKGDALNGVLSFDASVYYIDWKDIHLQTLDPVTRVATYFNGSRASSSGVELSLDARPISGMTVSTWVAWNDAKLTEPFPAGSLAYGAKGDRLPVSPRISGSLAVDQRFALGTSYEGYAGGSISYVGDRVGVFRGVANGVPLPRQTFGGYAQTDLRAGVTRDSWSLNLALSNVTDKRGELRGGKGYTLPYAFYYNRPRTLDLTIAKSF